METSIFTNVRRGRPAFKSMVAVIALTAAASVSGATPAEGGAPDYLTPLQSQDELEQLEFCYADGTDAIGRGDLAGGRAIYRRCFTPNALITARLAYAPPGSPPLLSAVGPDAWADVVNATFRASGYIATQHMITNIETDTQFIKGTVKSYLNATQVIDPNGSIDIANGTYTSNVVRTLQGYKLASRDLKIIAFYRVESP